MAMKRVRESEIKISRLDSNGRAKRSALRWDLCGPVPLLPGEDAAAFEEYSNRVVNDVQPRDAIEEMWTNDIVTNQWEIYRLQRFRAELQASSADRDLKRMICYALVAEIPDSGVDDEG